MSRNTAGTVWNSAVIFQADWNPSVTFARRRGAVTSRGRMSHVNVAPLLCDVTASLRPRRQRRYALVGGVGVGGVKARSYLSMPSSLPIMTGTRSGVIRIAPDIELEQASGAGEQRRRPTDRETAPGERQQSTADNCPAHGERASE